MVQCHADGIKGILLIGAHGGKRRLYFERAAGEAGIPVAFLDWRELLRREREEDPCLDLRRAAGLQGGLERQGEPESGEESGRRQGEEDLRRWAVKIDAPEWESSRLDDLGKLTDRYMEWLNRLSGLPAGAFLNHPADIGEVLDKRRCKERLAQKGVPVTDMYRESFSGSEELLAFMRERRVGQLFVKPVRGSGAAGVAALRFSPGHGKLAVYTCAVLEKGEIFNTKRMRRLEGREGEAFLDSLLKLDCVVERWYGKDTFQGYCYDLRVILQGGRIDYILPRLSRGPITNLHLNNRSVEFADLSLDQRTVERISEACLRAGGCYPRLKSVGMDVLLEQGSRNPRIIEMNGQGDLLHRDVYGENRIYRRQIGILAKMLEKQC